MYDIETAYTRIQHIAPHAPSKSITIEGHTDTIHCRAAVGPTAHFQNCTALMSLSLSFFITFATAISKSSCVTCTLRSLKANMPASVPEPATKQSNKAQPPMSQPRSSDGDVARLPSRTCLHACV